MADIQQNIFSTLRRLFSTDVIIRNNGGGNILSVMDTDGTQRNGVIQTNSLIDRFHKVYTTSTAYGVNLNLAQNYQSARVQIYADYDAMDTDAIIASALDIIADEATLKNDQGHVLTIRSSDENIQKILENLFYSVLNIEFNLWSWIRNMCKYGDFYLKLEISEKFGVYNVIPFSAYNIVRQEGFNPNNPNEVRFKFDPNAALSSTSGYTSAYNNQDAGVWFDNYEMAHFRLIGDVNYLPYGRSYLEPARKLFKQYTLIEDAMLIHRITRAPERRIFYTNVGAIPPNEVENYVQRMINKMKKTPLMDPQTGQYNLKYNQQNLLEDFIVPVRGNDTSTRIDTAKGLEYNAIEDVVYFREKLFAALKIPKAFMGYEKDLTGKCLHPDTKISLLNGTTKTIKEISDIFEKDPQSNLWTYSFDFKTNSVVPGKIVTAQKTRLNAQLVKVYIDNDTYVITTPDHGFLLEDGTRVEAQDLKPGDSLRTIIKDFVKIGRKNTNTYERIYQPYSKTWQNTHKMVDEYFNEKITSNGITEDGKFNRNSLIIVHHKDFNRYNNNPDNLQRMTWRDHVILHSNNMEQTIKSPESIQKSKDTKRKPENRKKYSEIRKKQMDENPKLKNILRNSWLSKTYDERVAIIKSGYSEERSQKIINSNRQRNSHEALLDGYRNKFPNGRPDLHKENSVRWIERPTIEYLIEVAQREKGSIDNIVDFRKISGYSIQIIKEVIEHCGYTVTEFLNQYTGFRHGRPKNLRINRLVEIANGCKDLDQFFSISGYTRKSIKSQIQKHGLDIEDFKKQIGVCYNHKVVKVEWLSEKVDTYNMEVHDKNENHNYLLDNEIVIKNSTLAAEDIRFARTVERLQRIVVSELKKIALVHLYANGYTDEGMANFSLSLTNPSIIYDQERIAMFKEKIDLAAQAMEASILPKEYVWENVFHLSPDSFGELEDMIIEDKKTKFRYDQIENEGNDPLESGTAFGTPSQIAGLYGGKPALDVPPGYNETNPNEPIKMPGRPEKYKSIIGTDKSIFGRDPIGKKGMSSSIERGEDKVEYKGGPLSFESTMAVYLQNKDGLEKMFKGKKISLFEGKSQEGGLLDERNIKEEIV
jgi:hypothetical protein